MASHQDLTGNSSRVWQKKTELFDYAQLGEAIEAERFKRLLDHIPIALLISKNLSGVQRIVYANRAFEKLVGRSVDDVKLHVGLILDAFRHEDDPALTLRKALEEDKHYVGTFQLDAPNRLVVEAYTSLIENGDHTENYRIFALIDVTERTRKQREELSRRLRDGELLLRELQHRVRNNLQLITSMIRLEGRNKREDAPVSFDKLVSRIETLQLLYRDLTPEAWGNALDLGHYISQIASAVMHAHAVDGIRLDLKVDHAMASANVAMPVGLLINELMTNAFKHAFTGRKTGTIMIRCLHENKTDYRIVVADDGVGLPDGTSWPAPGKLSALILQTLRDNTEDAHVSVVSAPGKGTRVSLSFRHDPSLPTLQYEKPIYVEPSRKSVRTQGDGAKMPS